MTRIGFVVLLAGCGRFGFGVTGEPVHRDVVAAWGLKFGTGGTNAVRAIGASAEGVYFTGEFQGMFDVGGGPIASSGEDDAPIAWLGPTGAHGYSDVIAAGLGEDHGDALALLADGSLAVCGYFNQDTTVAGMFYTSRGGADAWVARVAPDGTTTRGFRHGAAAADRCIGIAVIDGDLVVILETNSGAGLDLGGGSLPGNGNYDVVVARFGQDGTHRWSRRFGGPGDDRAEALAVSADGEIYVVGMTDGGIDFGGGVLGEATPPDGFVAKLDGTGAHVWSQPIDGDGPVRLRDVDLSPEQLVVVGHSSGTIDVGGGPLSPGALAFALRTDRSHAWSLTLGGANAIRVAVDERGGAVIAGEYFEEIRLPLDDGSTALLPHVDQNEVFALAVEPAGQIVGAAAAVGVGNMFVSSIEEAGARVYVGGGFDGELASGSVSLSGTAVRDAYLIAFDIVPAP